MEKKRIIGVFGIAAAFTAAVAFRLLRTSARRQPAQIGDTVQCGEGQPDVSEENFLMPTESMRRILKPYRTRIAAGS